MSFSEYPFTRQAAERVKETGYSLGDLLETHSFQPVRKKAIDRVRGAVNGEIFSDSSHPMAELLSYPLARVMVSCLGDELLMRRYALAESKLASRMMKSEDPTTLILLAHDLGVRPVKQADFPVHHRASLPSKMEEDLLELHFTEYLKAAHRMRSPKWKLVNRSLKEGQVTITFKELARLLEERIRDRVLKDLPLQISPEICQKLEDYTAQIKQELDSTRPDQIVDLGKVTEEAFPPCMRQMLSQVAEGINLAHSARFALTSFLIHAGMSTDEVVQVFNTSPDFDEEKTRYQVEHIAGKSGTRYKPPSCATMATYGNCPGEDKLCKWVNHPLNYYRRKMKKKGLKA
ncbi:MAG: DNA primase regulatory subunit PriL [Methanotrichaceae archaeon]